MGFRYFLRHRRDGGGRCCPSRTGLPTVAKGKEMGKLAYSGITVELLGSDAAVVHGKWELAIAKGKDKGLTQVLRKFPDGWKITHDHSSH